jgi:hypothetical protein
VKQLSRNKIKTITLWIGILIALLLIFGSFFHSADTLVDNGAFSLMLKSASGEQIRAASSSLIKALQSLIL